ncbi:transposase [Tissierella carlieri]|uniref:Transposase n=1 Tax=Tissierella carlieri TaxID=689904 RepID=A0ABT1S6S1_9FIRM|nr:transposase [Tissierella carlieri]MCQ4922156.1 transposase [Tissierella carlieri]
MLVLESVRVLREIDRTLNIILAEIGDVRRFKNRKSLVAYAGMDAPLYESGNFKGTQRKISKRGPAILRKIGYEVMKCIKSNKASEDLVYQFMMKKEAEGKPLKVAKIAALNKLLRIYYARIKEVYTV